MRQTTKRLSTGVLTRLTLGVVTLGPVVPGTRLAEHEIVRAKNPSVRSTSYGIHSARLQVHQDCPGHVLPAVGLVVGGFDPLQLQLRLPGIGNRGVDNVFFTERKRSTIIPENFRVEHSKSEIPDDLVTALTSLDVDNLSHLQLPGSRQSSL